jgi:hypothetical protein
MTRETIPLVDHLDALRVADATLFAERDRRYQEVNIEREKALRIKEEADKVALDLARQIQTYKDEQHNGLLGELRDQRGSQASKAELRQVEEKLLLAIEPLSKYIAGQVIGNQKTGALWAALATVAFLVVAFGSLLLSR